MIDLSPDNVPDINVITGNNVQYWFIFVVTYILFFFLLLIYLSVLIFFNFRRFQRLFKRVTGTIIYEAFIPNDRGRVKRLHV